MQNYYESELKERIFSSRAVRRRWQSTGERPVSATPAFGCWLDTIYESKYFMV
jgi:hypothetical protein